MKSFLRLLIALQAEIAEERFMLRRTKEENEILRNFFIRYKNQLGDLQVQFPAGSGFECTLELLDNAGSAFYALSLIDILPYIGYVRRA